MITKLSFYKISDSLPMASCWFCKSPTNNAMDEQDGSQIWCCKGCYQKHGRIVTRIRDYSKSHEKIANNTGKNGEKLILRITSSPQMKLEMFK